MYKIVVSCVFILFSQMGFSSPRQSSGDEIGDLVFSKENRVQSCGIPLVDIDIANGIIKKINRQKIVCKASGGFSVNGKSFAGLSRNGLSELIRDGVFSCQDYTDGNVFAKPERNDCVRKIESDVKYFLSMTKDGRVKTFPLPYDIAVSRTSTGGRFINFRVWADYALTKGASLY